MRRTTTAVSAAALLLLTACGTQTSERPVASPQPSSSGPVCATATIAAHGDLYDAADGVRLPADFVATAVVECLVEARPVAGDGVWNFLVEKRATVKVDAFVTALRRPDEPSTGGVCTAIGYLVPWFAVVDASGRVLHATIPSTGCGQPQSQAMAAMQALPFVEVSATRRDRVQTEAQSKVDAAAAAIGCSTLFKDMIAITDADRRPMTSVPDPILGTSSGGVLVCRFSAAQDADGMPALTFVSGEKLTGAPSTAVVDALAASGSARPCGVAHTWVAGLFTEQNGWALVELDGCHRVEGGDSAGWRQATPELLALLR
jgi:hypothetical protein